jgi:hypothetical protein
VLVLAAMVHRRKYAPMGLPPLALHGTDGVNGQEPALIRVPASHFGDHRAVPKPLAQLSHGALAWRDKGIGRETVGDGQRLHP